MKKQSYNALHAGLLAVLIGILIMLPAAFMYNGMFMIRGDYTHQTITRLITAKNMLSCGSSPLWNWNNFLGTAYTGIYSTLLSFSAVCMLFPVKLMPYAVMLSLCIRWFVMGVSSYALLRRFVNSHRTALIGVLLYCFSGYSMACLEFAAFYNTMAVFPLLLLALEKRFTDEHYKYLLIPATVVNFIASTYLFIGSSIAMLVYALARFFTAEEWKKNRKLGYILLCFAEYFTGVLICGFTLFSFAGTMFSTARATSLIEANGVSKGSFVRLIVPKYFFDELAGIFMPAASNRVTTFFSYNKWFSMQAYLPLFGFSLCFAHILKRGFKDGISISTAALLLISFIPLLNNITSFYANSYTRWWYALTLVMIIATVRMLGDLDDYAACGLEKPGAHIKGGLVLQWAAIIAIPALFYAVRCLNGTSSMAVKRVIALFFNHDYSYGLAEDIFRLFSIIWAVVFTAALTVVLFSKKARRHTLPLLAVLITLYGMSFVVLNNSDAPVFDALLNGVTDDSPVRTQKTIVSRYYIDEKPINSGTYTYRTDHAGEVINYAAVINNPSIRYFESTIDTDAARFAEFAGMGAADSVLFDPPDNGNALRTLLSVRYYYDLFDDGGFFRFIFRCSKNSDFSGISFMPVFHCSFSVFSRRICTLPSGS